jgi:hypothetical protein
MAANPSLGHAETGLPVFGGTAVPLNEECAGATQWRIAFAGWHATRAPSKFHTHRTRLGRVRERNQEGR